MPGTNSYISLASLKTMTIDNIVPPEKFPWKKSPNYADTINESFVLASVVRHIAIQLSWVLIRRQIQRSKLTLSGQSSQCLLWTAETIFELQRKKNAFFASRFLLWNTKTSSAGVDDCGWRHERRSNSYGSRHDCNCANSWNGTIANHTSRRSRRHGASHRASTETLNNMKYAQRKEGEVKE